MPEILLGQKSSITNTFWQTYLWQCRGMIVAKYRSYMYPVLEVRSDGLEPSGGKWLVDQLGGRRRPSWGIKSGLQNGHI
jgi:hypothetical protein